MNLSLNLPPHCVSLEKALKILRQGGPRLALAQILEQTSLNELLGATILKEGQQNEEDHVRSEVLR